MRQIILAIFIIAIGSTPVLADDMLGSYSVHLSKAVSPANATNAVLAAEMLNNTVVEPGQVFSFNETIGERTEEKGFTKGLITTSNHRPLYDIGGGICMCSSILYQAAKQANLTIIERHNHVSQTTYLPLGQDAAIQWGKMDFKFQNKLTFPITIRTGVFDNCLLVTINRATCPPVYVNGEKYEMNAVIKDGFVMVNYEEIKAVIPGINLIADQYGRVPIRDVAVAVNMQLAWENQSVVMYVYSEAQIKKE